MYSVLKNYSNDIVSRVNEPAVGYFLTALKREK